MATTINLCSDLHLEFGDVTLPGGDVLILAGDACEAANLMRPKPTANYLRFFNEECAKYAQVIYVLGNHEHYNYRYDQTQDHIQAQVPNNVHLLEQGSLAIGDVTFLGGTMWTDMNRGDPSTCWYVKRNMNDFRRIRLPQPDTGSLWPITPEFVEQVHKETLEYFTKELAKNPQGKFVVVSHHAPSHLSIPAEYKADFLMNGGYASDLSAFILDHPQIKVWCHGHTHTFFDYTIGGTRVLCNPRGYHGYEARSQQFDPSFSFEV